MVENMLRPKVAESLSSLAGYQPGVSLELSVSQAVLFLAAELHVLLGLELLVELDRVPGRLQDESGHFFEGLASHRQAEE